MKAIALGLFFCLGSLGANPLKEAVRPLDEGVPEVAVERLQRLLAEHPPAVEEATAKAKLTEALVRSGQPAAALQVWPAAAAAKDPAALFWRAQALAALARWAEAQAAYHQVAVQAEEPLRGDARFGEAQSSRALGQSAQALALFDSLRSDPRWKAPASLGAAALLLDRGDLGEAERLLRKLAPAQPADRSEQLFLLGRIQLAQHHPDRALAAWGPLLDKQKPVSHPLLIATLLAVAEAHLQAGTAERGDDLLEQFIDDHPADPSLPVLFAKLNTLYQAERKASPNELRRWARDRAEPRRAFALWGLARSQLRSGDRAAALATLARIDRTAVQQLPSLGPAFLEQARLLLADGQWDAAIRAAETARRQNPTPAFAPEADWLRAEASYRAGRLAQAAPIFEEIAQGDSNLASAAYFNAALCWLRLEEPEKFASDYRRISNQPAQQGELLLEEGALEAAQGKAEAANSFQKFIRDFPQSPRVAEAWVALAELAFHAREPDLDTARQDLARARLGRPAPAALERADYLEIWLADAAPAAEKSQVIAAALAFLQKHPGSAFTPEVRMKLAEVYFRRQDFANAQTQFELLAQQNPQAALAEKALFFAGRAALSSMGAASLDHALALFDQVVKLNGELKWPARNEEAAIERRLGKNSDALAIYDEVLKNPAKPPDRREALCGEGDVYYEMGASDPQSYRRAIEFFEKLANDPGVPAHWRNQAEFKKGKALEKLNDRTGALATYYRVIEGGGGPDREHEYFWFYKAGFNAAHLLEEASDWKAAVAVYRKLAAVGGARSEEAKTRLTQLRMEHFLWEE